MKLNVSKEITSMNLNDYKQKCIPDLIIKSYKRTRLTLKTVQPDSRISQSALIFFNFYPSISSFVFAMLLKCCFTILSGYFYTSLNLMAIFLCLNLAKFRDTIPLRCSTSALLSKPNILPVCPLHVV